MSDWVLHRLNHLEASFALQSHQKVVTVGRANGQNKQLLGEDIVQTVCETTMLSILAYFPQLTTFRAATPSSDA